MSSHGFLQGTYLACHVGCIYIYHNVENGEKRSLASIKDGKAGEQPARLELLQFSLHDRGV